MNRALLLGGIALLTALGGSVVWPTEPTAAASPVEWEDPEVFQRNREPPRATLFNYESIAAARRGDRLTSALHLSLDGTWKFRWSSDPSLRPKDFWQRGHDVTDWDDISVPGNIELQGYGRPYYVNFGYAFPMDQPNVPDDYNHVGSYKRTFELPAKWSGKEVILRFGAAGAGFYVWVNGRAVGYSESSKDPAEFNVAEHLVAGRNEVAVELYRFTDGSYLEDIDFWRLSGFDRGVSLTALPEVSLRDYFVKAGLDDAYRDGIFELAVDLAGHAEASGAYTIDVELFEGARPVFRERRHLGAPGEPLRLAPLSFRGTIPDVRRWTAETPDLYRMLVTIRNANGHVIAAMPADVGFRTVEVRGNQLLVNGRSVTIRGVNLHEHDHRTGHVVSTDTLEADVRMMKTLNINAIRTSHYPARPHLYELADRYGLYVVDEANIESHGYMVAGEWVGPKEAWQLGHQPEWAAAHLARVKALVERDKNHPSVIVWSLGNEAGEGPVFQRMYDWVKARDDTRPVQYQAGGLDAPYTDLGVPFYPTPAELDELATGFADRPLVLGEYAHAMGNSVGGLTDIWAVIDRHAHVQGGFIWDWVDQGLLQVRQDGSTFFAYGGDFGPRFMPKFGGKNARRGTFCANGLLQSDRTPNPHAWEVRKVYQPVRFVARDLARGVVTVRSRFDFADLSAFDLVWEITEDGVARWSGAGPALTTPAQASEDVRLELPAIEPEPGAEYALKVSLIAQDDTHPLLGSGDEVAWEQFVLPHAAARPRPSRADAAAARHVESDDAIQISGPRFSARFDKSSGALVSLVYEGKEHIRTPPQPNFWRAVTENDIGWGAPEHLAVWKNASDTRVLEAIEARDTPGAVVVSVRQTVGDRVGRVLTTYEFAGSGDIRVTSALRDLADGLPELPRYGMMMTLPAGFGSIEWYGRGPHESYADRKSGAALGRYEGSVWEQYHDYIRPQETGNKTDVRWMALRRADGGGLLIVGDPTFSGAALAFAYADLHYDPANNRHGSDIKPGDLVTVMVDHAQMGVGGDDSWGKKPLARYMIPARPTTYSFRLRPFSAGEDPAALARQTFDR